MIPKLAKLYGASFESAHAASLDELRRVGSEHTAKAGSHGAFLLTSCGLASDSTNLPTSAQTGRLAALEMLYHTYFHSTKGKEAVWIVSIPSNYTTWPHLQLNNQTVANVLASFNAGEKERFTATVRKHIATAAQTGLAWTLKAQVVLDDRLQGNDFA